MKKVFISILLFYLIFHFVIPGIYFLIDGNFNTYTGTEDNENILKAFLLNAITILGTILIIILLPEKKSETKIAPKFYKLTTLFYISICFSGIYFFAGGGFEGRISGRTLGSVFNYIAFFLSPFMILLCVLFFQRRKFNIIVLFLIYLMYATATGSRSGIFSLLIIFLIYPLFANYKVYKKSIRRLLLFLLILSPLMYILATVLIRRADIPLSTDIIVRMIMGRLSFLETSMLPIHYKALNDPLDIFYTKYGIINQIKLAIDALFPGNLFGGDVMPNQYYRAAFMGYTESYVATAYMSVNITLPIYLYMYFGGFFSCVVGIGILVFYYKLCVKFKNRAFLFVPLIATLYGTLVYFDWVMWFIQVFTFGLTMCTVYSYGIIRSAMVKAIKTNAI
jgi:hypothetical protein